MCRRMAPRKVLRQGDGGVGCEGGRDGVAGASQWMRVVLWRGLGGIEHAGEATAAACVH
jgi:hypothetical protein